MAGVQSRDFCGGIADFDERNIHFLGGVGGDFSDVQAQGRVSPVQTCRKRRTTSFEGEGILLMGGQIEGTVLYGEVKVAGESGA